MQQCQECQNLGEALRQIDSLTKSLLEAKLYLREGDSPGKACESCRGVAAHFEGCKIALALRTIDNALSGLAEA